MSGKRKVVYWDTCIFLAWIKQEKCWPDDAIKGIAQTVEEWRARRVVIATSTITILEVLSSEMTQAHKDSFTKVFSDQRLQLIDVDRRIAGKAHAIRSHYDDRVFGKDGTCVSGKIMGMGDAIHLATAIHYEVREFITLDGAGKSQRKYNLLSLNGNVAGAKLAICMPYYVPPPKPLEGSVSPVSGSQQGLFEGVSQAGTETAEKESAVKKPEPERLEAKANDSL